MLDSAVLLDILGSKVLASMSFKRNAIVEPLTGEIIQRYYELVQSGPPAEQVHLQIEDTDLCACRINDVTVLVVASDAGPVSDEDMVRITALQKVIIEEVAQSSVRDFKSRFADVALSALQRPLNICFVSPPEPSPEDCTGQAVKTFMTRWQEEESIYSRPVRMGPYRVRAMRCDYRDIERKDWSEGLSQADVFCLVVSNPLPASDRIEGAVLRIRDESQAPVVVAPGSDAELEFARAVENSYGIDLCDSVSEKPSYLLLSVLAIAGFSDIQPELASEQWVLEPGLDETEVTSEKEPTELGHQAFFVVDRRDGIPRYSYYYDERSQLLEMAPNIVAAITSFKIDQTTPTATSVFRTGDLSYITIERDKYVFTLVTGQHSDVEALRERFSFLPDLFMDEVPEPIEDPTDLFRSPPFTLKLLATLPPQKLAGRTAPVQKRAMLWERFEHPAVGDFLEAVWNRLDGSLVMSRLAPGKNPEIIIGAIHLLHRMGAIEFKLKIGPDDVPVIVNPPDEETLGLYANLGEILDLVDGDLSVDSISKALDIDLSVLVTVLAELDRRNVISFRNNYDSHTKAS
ncbi:MAG: hypothetical protein ACP6KW_02915 [Candidatus Thorarchaeota archaeon]